MGEPRIALGPEDRSKRPRDYLFRAAVVHLRSEGRNTAKIVKQLYGDDRVTPLIRRAASGQEDKAAIPCMNLRRRIAFAQGHEPITSGNGRQRDGVPASVG